MSWFKVVVGFVIMIGVLIAWFKVMAHLKGGSSSGFKFDKPGRKGRGRDNDLERFIAAHRSGAAGPVDARPASAPPASAAPASPLPVPPPAARAASAPSGAALEGPLKVAYLLVRSTYPELVAFPNFAAARLPGLAPGATARDRVFDIVLCRPDLTPVAVIVLREGSMPGTSPEAQILGPAIRCVELDPRQLPRREQLRQLLALP
jgi:hypothetical protein